MTNKIIYYQNDNSLFSSIIKLSLLQFFTQACPPPQTDGAAGHIFLPVSVVHRGCPVQ